MGAGIKGRKRARWYVHSVTDYSGVWSRGEVTHKSIRTKAKESVYNTK